MIEPNWVAYTALVGWGIATLLAFAWLRPSAALLFAVVGAELLLPVGAMFQISGFPNLDRGRIAILAALAGTALFHGSRLRFEWPGWTAAVLLAPIAGALLTVRANSDPLSFGPTTVLPALTIHDAVSYGAAATLDRSLPFVLALASFRTRRDLELLLRVLVATGIAYSTLALFEARFSPHLHFWVYGYLQHSWFQIMRGEGWRPIVFTPHGLQLAMFFMSTLLAAATLTRARVRLPWGLPGMAVTAYLLLVLVVCKSWAPALFGVVGLALVAFGTDRARIAASILLLALVFLYPALRAADLFPADALVSSAESLSANRAESLAFRFENEDHLLAHARERLWTGWGTFGRNRVFDRESGVVTSVTDGLWIIELGAFGVPGLVSIFALMGAPILVTALRLERVRSRSSRILLSGLAVMVALRAVDHLPNASLTPLPFLTFGALTALAARIPRGERARARVGRRQESGEPEGPAPAVTARVGEALR